VVVAEYIDEDRTSTLLTVAQQQAMVDAASSEPRTFAILGLGDFRIVAERAQGRIYIVGLSLDDVAGTTTSLIVIFALVTLAALIVAGVAGTLVVRVALRPLGRVAATATRVAELPLDKGEVALAERVAEQDTDPRTEVGKVGTALNRMLGHIESALVSRQRSEDKVRQFVADASHELRTPLASIRGYSELTRRGGHELPEDVVRAIGRIESESVRMTSLVEDLLLLARLDAGRELVLGEVDLVPLVADAVGDAHAASPDHEWSLDAPEDPVIVVGDGGRLHQIVANLLANARVHTPAGTAVHTTLATEGGAAVLTVADDGPGIPADLQPVVFERFARGDGSRSRATGSTGLGLSIVAAVVEAHHGTVEVESAPGRTRFTVRLPVSSQV
jgi:two-component system OmpR family sensor kinase